MIKKTLFLVLIVAATTTTATSTHLRGRQLQAEAAGMDAAMDAANQLTGFVKDQLTGFLAEVKATEADVKSWADKWNEHGLLNIPNYEAAVATASIQLADANKQATLLISSLDTLVSIGLKQLDAAFAGGNTKKIKSAIQNAQLVMGASLKDANTKLKTLVSQLQTAQISLAKVAAMSKANADLLQSSIDGESSWVKGKIKDLREEVYAGVCPAVCVVSGGTLCAPCYATAAPIVETKVKDLHDTLKSQKVTVENIKDMYLKNAASAKALETTATANYNQLATAESAVSTAAIVLPTASTISFWKMITVPTLQKLDKTLKATLAELSSGSGSRRLHALASSPGSAATQAAVTAMQKLSDFVETQLVSFVNDAKEAALAARSYPKFSTEVNAAIADVTSVHNQGKALLESLENVLSNALHELRSAFAGSDQNAMKSAIQSTESKLAASLANAGTQLQDLESELNTAQVTFTKVVSLAEGYMRTLVHSIADVSSSDAEKIKHWREEAYGSCAAICVATLGLGCGPCYATAASIVETKVAHLEHALQDQAEAAARVVRKYSGVAGTARTIVSSAKSEKNGLLAAASDVSATAALVPVDATVSFWKDVMAAPAGMLQTTASKITSVLAKMD